MKKSACPVHLSSHSPFWLIWVLLPGTPLQTCLKCFSCHRISAGSFCCVLCPPIRPPKTKRSTRSARSSRPFPADVERCAPGPPRRIAPSSGSFGRSSSGSSVSRGTNVRERERTVGRYGTAWAAVRCGWEGVSLVLLFGESVMLHRCPLG